LSSVGEFLDFCYHHFSHLDILINNAAQTISRPPAYYEALRAQENSLKALKTDVKEDQQEEPPAKVARQNSNSSSIVSRRSPRLKLQLPDQLRKEDSFSPATTARFFPVGSVDAHGEQLDLRPRLVIPQT